VIANEQHSLVVAWLLSEAFIVDEVKENGGAEAWQDL